MSAAKVEELIGDLSRRGLVCALRDARANLEGADAELRERALALFREGSISRHAIVSCWCDDRRVDR